MGHKRKWTFMSLQILDDVRKGKMTFAEMFPRAREAGFTAYDATAQDAEFATRREVMRLCAENGLSIADYIHWVHLTTPDEDAFRSAVDSGCRAVQTALQHGTDKLMIVENVVPEDLAAMSREAAAARLAEGLRRINAGHCLAGVRAMIEAAGFSGRQIEAETVSFSIAPRINAAGRLATMEYGIECLLTDDPDRARHYAEALNQINQERRELEEEMQHAADLAVAAADIEHVHALSLLDDSFNEGVVGLVASRIKEKVHRPTVAFAHTAEGELKGSGRSIPGIHLRDMLDLVSKTEPGLILRFGGHAMAAGLTIQEKDYDRFARAFEAVVAEHADPAVFERNVLIDGGLAPDEISERLCQTLEHGIWGQGFDAPLFANDFRVVRQTVLKDAHLKLSLELGGQRFEGIFFRRNAPLLTASRLAYRPTINEFNGRRLIQLLVEAVES